MSEQLLSNLISGVGVVLLLVSFFFVTLAKIQSDGPTYLWFNFFGGGLSAYGALIIKFWPFVFLEGIWFLFAGYGLIRLLVLRRS